MVHWNTQQFWSFPVVELHNDILTWRTNSKIFNEFSSIQFYSYNVKSQQQLPQGALYCKVIQYKQ